MKARDQELDDWESWPAEEQTVGVSVLREQEIAATISLRKPPSPQSGLEAIGR